jgi:cytochrome P450
VLETLRLFPTAPFIVRESIDDTEVNGLKIPKGSLVNINVWMIHRDIEYWQEPNAFIPDRFMSSKSPRAYFPFSTGSHQCIGQKLAILEVKLAIAMIVRAFQLDLVPNQDITPIVRVTLQPKLGLLLYISSRSKTHD